MNQTLGLKFHDYGPIYYFTSGPLVVHVGDRIIVNTERGMGLGRVVLVRDEILHDVGPQELKPIYRLASEEDLNKLSQNEILAREAFEHCRQCIRSRQLDMKLVDVEVFFDRSKIIFYFTAPNRIDFRELVKDLVKAYHARIELRQIGVRHETQMIGAVGNCGMVCCCCGFLRKFVPVTIKMAKEQNLFLNPTKISGMCGRLLCCLSYEQANYEQFYRQCPKIGKKFTTDEGDYKVVRTNIFNKGLVVVSDTGEERELILEDWLALNPRRYDQERSQDGEDRFEEAEDYSSEECSIKGQFDQLERRVGGRRPEFDEHRSENCCPEFSQSQAVTLLGQGRPVVEVEALTRAIEPTVKAVIAGPSTALLLNEKLVVRAAPETDSFISNYDLRLALGRTPEIIQLSASIGEQPISVSQLSKAQLGCDRRRCKRKHSVKPKAE
ncbi:hypothetical protein DSUL_80019 [Desulfovibrionales bacterium]